MTTTPTSTPDDDPTLDTLWATACHWVHVLTATFGESAELARVGLTRSLALRCHNWLWSIEGLVRRVLVAAALAFDMRKLPPPRPTLRVTTKGAGRPAAPRPPCFNLFAFAASPRAASPRPARQRSASEPSPPYGHLRFPTDDLLRIGASRERHAARRREAGEAAIAPRAPNPLRRRGRISRWDPDYRGAPNQDPLLFRPATPTGSRLASQPRPRAMPVSALHHLPDLSDWRRVEEEWQRTLPAPLLATRITALLRVVDQPGRWISRLARRLQTSNLAARLAAHPPPRLRRPRLDRSPPPPLQEELALAHAFLDTS
ncbi:MAG: hypothetical protein Q8R02_01905 [Hyphomonadaceae bacterium]|nr:hypothetical protein [Hyphomonadaceae bacterium]